MSKCKKLKRLRTFFVVFCTISLASCVITRPVFNEFSGGVLDGKVALGWNDTTSFVYYPVDGNPLRYSVPKNVQFSGNEFVDSSELFTTIRPQLMFTDAGSIPRSFWSIKGLSPLDYLPAFIIHDWLYLQSRCWALKKGHLWKLNRDRGIGLKKFPYTRSVADKILFDALDAVDRNRPSESDVSPADAQRAKRLIRAAVQGFGASPYGTKERCDIPPSRTVVTVQSVKRKVRLPDSRVPGRRSLAAPRFKTVVTQRKSTSSRYRTIRTF